MAGLNLSKTQAGMNKVIQKSRAYPDLFILEARQGYRGLFIELKKAGAKIKKRNGDYADEHIKEQAEMLGRLRGKGYYAQFGIGWDECKQIIDFYLGK